jgi:uncharacterized membrane protein
VARNRASPAGVTAPPADEARLEAKEEAVEGASTDRLKAFSDGTFSILITLLVLELKVPPVAASEGMTTGSILLVLLRQWPMYVAYLLGFVTIGVMWANHCVLFRYIARTNHKIIALNTFLLLMVSLTPFVTALLSSYLTTDLAHQRAATLVYTGLNFFMALAFNGLWNYAIRPPRPLLDAALDPRLFDIVTRRYRYGPHIYAATFAVAFFSVPLSLAVIAALALFYALPYEPGAAAEMPFKRGRH